jgi:hypothetical protein
VQTKEKLFTPPAYAGLDAREGIFNLRLTGDYCVRLQTLPLFARPRFWRIGHFPVGSGSGWGKINREILKESRAEKLKAHYEQETPSFRCNRSGGGSSGMGGSRHLSGEKKHRHA